jgi:hypothetical protein
VSLWRHQRHIHAVWRWQEAAPAALLAVIKPVRCFAVGMT